MAQHTRVTTSRTYRVAEVAALTGVTVRTLHHYDEIGLLPPSERSRAGYRLYTDADLLRLQQILIQRELGLPLEQIRRVLDDPAFDLNAALLSQKAALEVRAAHTRSMLDAVDVALAKLAATTYSPQEESKTMQDLFLGFNPEPYYDEARQRWGDGDGDVNAYTESRRRTKSYTRDDWQRFATEQNDVYRELASLLSAGVDPTDAAAQAVVERLRLLIDRPPSWVRPPHLRCGPTHRPRRA